MHPWALERRGESCACRAAAADIKQQKSVKTICVYLQLLLQTVPVPAKAELRVTLSNNDDKQRFTWVSHPTCQIVTVLGWQGFLGKRSTCIIRKRELTTMFQMWRTGPLRARDRCSDSQLRNKWPAQIHKRSPCVLAKCLCCNYVYFLMPSIHLENVTVELLGRLALKRQLQAAEYVG